MIQTIRRILKKLGIALGLVVVLFLAVLVYRGNQANSLPDLEPWHNLPKKPDTLFKSEYPDFAAYLADEKTYIDEAYAAVAVSGTGSYNKYDRASISSPYDAAGQNLNSSFELTPETAAMRGGILLVHGLTDSPYHLRAVANTFADSGFYVISLRLPGHGTVPGALLNVSWQDWYAAVQFGADMVTQKIAGVRDAKFFVGGFSTGGALVLRHTLHAAADDSVRTPDGLLLLSPAIGIDPFAEVTDWHRLISWLPWFQKFKWFEVKPEYDPFKYNSFAKNAADQIFDLTIANQELVAKAADSAAWHENIPPMLAVQSRVDATVLTNDLLEMFAKIGSADSELLLFDVNRVHAPAMLAEALADVYESEVMDRIDSRALLIANRHAASSDSAELGIHIRTRTGDAASAAVARALGPEVEKLAWPLTIFALSHVSIPISPLDRFYGETSILGRINVKGERDVLLLGDDLGRIRYNPFYDIVESRITDLFLSAGAGALTSKR